MTNNSSSADVPAFIGFVETTVHALRLIHAARQGVIPRITRRLNDSERRTMIKSGAVFVFSVEESGIKRWTDGLLWSPSRIVGNFLVYREINERNSSRAGHKKPYPSSSGSQDLSIGYKSHSGSSDQGTFKPNGLIKKTITVTVEGSDLHLISYYTSEDIRSGRLKKPTSRPDIMALPMPPHIFRLTNFRNPPKVEIGADGKPRLVSEQEDNEAVDCKTEEQQYPISSSPPWSPAHSQGSPIDNSYSTSSVYPMPSTHHDHLRHGSGERWPLPLDNLRPISQRAEVPWNVSPSSVHLGHDISNRRDSLINQQSNSWSSMQSNSNRWVGGGYDSSSAQTCLYPDRSRARSGSGYQTLIGLQTREDHNQTREYTYPQGQTSGNRDHHAHRNTWLTSAEPSSRDSRTPNSGGSYEPQQTHFSPHGYHHAASHSYGSTWSPTDAVSLDLPTSQSPFSPHSNLHYSYETTYTGSGTVSSPEDYTKVEEYTDS